MNRENNFLFICIERTFFFFFSEANIVIHTLHPEIEKDYLYMRSPIKVELECLSSGKLALASSNCEGFETHVFLNKRRVVNHPRFLEDGDILEVANCHRAFCRPLRRPLVIFDGLFYLFSVCCKNLKEMLLSLSISF